MDSGPVANSFYLQLNNIVEEENIYTTRMPWINDSTLFISKHICESYSLIY